MPTIEQIQQLPYLTRHTVTTDHLDAMGHMNVRWYLAFFDDAAWTLFESFGMTADYYRENQAGGFALQHIIRYLAEVRVGETVAIYGRVVTRTEKRVQFMYFMVNETTQTLAATLEGVGAHADMTVRRTAPYPPHIATILDDMIATHQQLDWEAPLSGAIQM
mgnify:CR=1 FL=1